MSATYIEKVFTLKSGKKRVYAGDIVTTPVDFCMINDATMRLNIDLIENVFGVSSLHDPNKVIIVHDHQVPANDPLTAETHRLSKAFAQRFGISRFHAADGICHQVMIENYILPQQLVLGADSHTLSIGCLGAIGIGMGSTDICAAMIHGESWFKVPETILIKLEGKFSKGVYAKDLALQIISKIGQHELSYCALEFVGSGTKYLSISERFTLCNMAAEAGAKTAFFAPDQIVADYLLLRQRPHSIPLKALMETEKDTNYKDIFTFNLDVLEPLVACPHTIDNISNVSEVANIKLDQVFIGSCTNGRLDDLREVAAILKGKTIHPDITMIIAPASITVYQQALAEGIIDTFIQAGGQVQHPNCSTCWGACQGVLSKGQKMLSTQNRNYRGRSGSPEAEIYLASPRTVAVSALRGKITDPRDFL